jgi:hypothetical protein
LKEPSGISNLKCNSWNSNPGMNSAIRGNRNERRTWCGVSGQSFVKQGTSILLGLPRNNKQKKGPEINKKVEEQKIRDSGFHSQTGCQAF